MSLGAIAAALIVLASCGGTPPTTVVGNTDQATSQVMERMDLIDGAVAAWRSATSLDEAQMAAETAANLIVGPDGPGYGDRNGDGVVSGDTTVGLLPGLDAGSSGLASALAGNSCVARDVLGGDWTEPEAEWGGMSAAIDAWRPDNNTMPSLASHPMRIVGWATFTIASDSLDEATEYGGHAKLHVDVTLRALDC